MHKTVAAELMNVFGLWDLNEKKVEELLYLLVFIWSPRSKDDLDRTGMKKLIKTAKFCMLWNVPPDLLPGSATVPCFGPLA